MLSLRTTQRLEAGAPPTDGVGRAAGRARHAEDIIRGSISYRDPMEELSNPLPPGWVEVEDDDGRIYFFHERSGETTWNRPRDRFVSTPL